MFVFGYKSKQELIGVHSHLVIVTTEALLKVNIDFAVHDGIRTIEEQKEYVAKGSSWTMKSRHLTGHAVDLVPYINGKITWDSTKAFIHIGRTMLQVAERYKIQLKWGANIKYGGNWKARNDMAHFELDRRFYPA